jgi:ketosteroid isomerase-like protein
MADDAGILTMRRFYDAFQSGDADVLRELLSDCTWHTPGESLIAGAFSGGDEIVTRFGRLRERTEGTLTFHLHEILGDGQHVVGLDRVTARRGDRTLDMNRVVIAHARDGQLMEVWLVPEDQYAFDEFWS